VRLLEGVRAAADFSEDGVYRYTLERRWSTGGPPVLWIMLNPSTADAETDDRTVRRCQDFTRAWGYHGAVIANLFALRSTDPKALYDHPAPVGPLNDGYIQNAVTEAGLVVAAWGTHGALRGRGAAVLTMLARMRVEVHRLGPAT